MKTFQRGSKKVLDHVLTGKNKHTTRLNIFSHWEKREIKHLLYDDEKLLGAVSGFYTAGMATLCVTNRRLLLVDKKFVRLNIEDVRFESITEFEYSRQLLMGCIQVHLYSHKIKFTSWYARELRSLAEIVQDKMFESRAAQDHANLQIQKMGEPVQAPALQNFSQYVPKPKNTTSLRGSAAWALGGQQQALWAYYQKLERWRRAGRYLGYISSSI